MHTVDDSTPTSLPRAALVPLTGSQVEPISLSKTLTLVGSGTGVHICLQTRTVEEFHAAIVNSDGHVYVRDLGTLAGIVLNRQHVREAVLREGDEIQFGKVSFRFEGGNRYAGDQTIAGEDAELCVGSTMHSLRERVALIGRGPRCELRLEDDLSSDKHAVVYWADGSWRVRILTPGPGTLLNERSVRRARLHPGDVLTIGRSEILFRPGHSESEAAPGSDPSAPAKESPAQPEPPKAAPPAPAVRSPQSAPPPPVTSSEDADFVRGWGPVAAAMATAHSAAPQDSEPIAAAAGPATPPHHRRWIVGATVGVIVLAAALVGVFIWLSR